MLRLSSGLIGMIVDLCSGFKGSFKGPFKGGFEDFTGSVEGFMRVYRGVNSHLHSF